MSMRGSQKKECEWGKILTPTMIHCGSQDHLSVNDKSQSSSYWQCWGTAVLCDYAGTCVEVNVGGGETHQCGRVAICIRTELNPGGPVGWFGRDKDTEALPMIAQMMRSNQSRDNSLPI